MNHKFTSSIFIMLFFLWGTPQISNAQDPHFSQFYAAPLHVNPAMTGVFDGSYRVVLNYRDQWSSVLGSQPFRTVAASFEYRYNVSGNDYFSGGIAALHDEVGSARFNQNKAHLSLSYMKQLSGGGYAANSQFLIGGAQLGVGQNSIDWGDLWFSRQYDSGNEQINTSLASGENQGDKTDMYLDFNAGILWFASIEHNKSIYLGGAIHHINGPNISVIDGEEDILYNKYTAHFGGEFPFSETLSIMPAGILSMQGPSMELVSGANFRYTNHDWRELAVRVGLWGRAANKLDGGMHMDALIFSAILEVERWNFGLSYDINTSSLSDATDSRGAFEVSLIYYHPGERRTRVHCPNF